MPFFVAIVVFKQSLLSPVAPFLDAEWFTQCVFDHSLKPGTMGLQDPLIT